jgi:phenylalanyl-tRNA synthetase beta chain
VEEVARLYGYDRLPTTLLEEELPMPRRNRDLELEEWARDILVGCGLTETISYSMTNLESVAKLTPARTLPDAESYLRVTNPLSRDHEYLRQTLLNTTLETVASNLRFGERVAIFEIANVYLPQGGVDAPTLPAQPRRLSIALSGPREERSWHVPAGALMDFYDLKGALEALCAHLGVGEVRYAPVQHPTFHPGRAASIALGETPLGVLGEVHPLVRANYDLPEQCITLLELDLDALLAAAQPTQHFAAFSRMPALREDLAFTVAEEVPSDALAGLIRQAGGKLLVEVVLFDIYRGPQIGAGNKSLAYRLTFQSPDATLTTEEVAKQRARIIQRLAEAVGAQVRG